MLQRIRELFDRNPDEDDILNQIKYTDGTDIFSGRLTESVQYDIVECMRITKEQYPEFDYERLLLWFQDNAFTTPADLIYNLPIFSSEAEHYRMKRHGEDLKEEITESLYHCHRCQRPVASQTRQTRASDEGVTVFVHCAHCNISRTV